MVVHHAKVFRDPVIRVSNMLSFMLGVVMFGAMTFLPLFLQVVTGATPAGVRAAAGLLDAAKLRDHYAVATEDGKQTPLPVEAP